MRTSSIFCIQGQIIVELVSTDKTEKVTLNPGDVAFLDRMVWSQQEYVTGEEIMLVLCSRSFDKEDYFYERGDVNK